MTAPEQPLFEPHPLLGPRYQKGDCALCWHAYVGRGRRLVIRHLGPNPVPGRSREEYHTADCPQPRCPRRFLAPDGTAYRD